MEQLPSLLGLDGLSVGFQKVRRATIAATHLHAEVSPAANREKENLSGPGNSLDESETHLVVDPPERHDHASYADIQRMIGESALPVDVRERAQGIFTLIATVEAEAHGIDLAEVAFHEIGTADSIFDVVAAAYCIQKVSPAHFYATPLRPGRGFIKIAHGTHPVPPPASSRLLVGLPMAPTPSAIRAENIELSTPTGIAILKSIDPTFVTEMPPGVLKSQGLGAGSKDFGDFPNVFRVALLEPMPASAPALPYESDEVVEIACNIDDDTSEHIAWLAESLLKVGALDVTLAPVTGKKGRPQVVLSLLCIPDDQARLSDWLLRHSTTFGIRYRTWSRLKLSRRFETRTGPEGEVIYKIGQTTLGEVLKAKPEFDSQRQAWDRNADRSQE